MLVAAQLLTCTVEGMSSHTVIEIRVYVLEYSSDKYLSFNYTMLPIGIISRCRYIPEVCVRQLSKVTCNYMYCT